jgi:hypothetical protein
LVSPARAGDDERLLRRGRGSVDFDRVERARIFLDTFPRSPLRPAALLLLGEAAGAAAARLSRDAARRLDAREMEAAGAPAHSYFLNFNGLLTCLTGDYLGPMAKRGQGPKVKDALRHDVGQLLALHGEMLGLRSRLEELRTRSLRVRRPAGVAAQPPLFRNDLLEEGMWAW